jgi:hypothetical protein
MIDPIGIGQTSGVQRAFELDFLIWSPIRASPYRPAAMISAAPLRPET